MKLQPAYFALVLSLHPQAVTLPRLLTRHILRRQRRLRCDTLAGAVVGIGVSTPGVCSTQLTPGREGKRSVGETVQCALLDLVKWGYLRRVGLGAGRKISVSPTADAGWYSYGTSGVGNFPLPRRRSESSSVCSSLSVSVSVATAQVRIFSPTRRWSVQSAQSHTTTVSLSLSQPPSTLLLPPPSPCGGLADFDIMPPCDRDEGKGRTGGKLPAEAASAALEVTTDPQLTFTDVTALLPVHPRVALTAC